MYTSIKNENPYAVFVTGDFNGHYNYAYIPRPEVFKSGDLQILSLKKRKKAGDVIPKSGGKSGENQRVLHC